MRETLHTGLSELDLRLGEADGDILCRYGSRLLEKNQVMNLTAITDPSQVASLHFLDCLYLAKLTDFSGGSLIDVGCGAGFPGLPLKIAVPSLSLTLLDSLGKRVDWLRELTDELNIGCTCINGRAEELAVKPEYFESYRFATARAVARLNILAELCLPFVEVGGCFIAMKGPDCDDELEEAKPAIKLMGGKTEKVADYTVPTTDVVHRAIIIRKIDHTPKGYPRRYAKIKKEPL